MGYRIHKSFEFAASHVLAGLPDDHPCSRLHGHNYRVEVELEGSQLDDVGFVMDYRALDPIKRFLDATIDHRHLNDLVSFNPTAEHLARWLHRKATDLLPGQRVSAVRVYETPKTGAEYRP